MNIEQLWELCRTVSGNWLLEVANGRDVYMSGAFQDTMSMVSTCVNATDFFDALDAEPEDGFLSLTRGLDDQEWIVAVDAIASFGMVCQVGKSVGTHVLLKGHRPSEAVLVREQPGVIKTRIRRAKERCSKN